MSEIKTKEFMASVEELKNLYPIGSIVEENGEKYRVLSIETPFATTCFASFPRIKFEKID